MRMETGCYSPLENKMRCQLNCRPSVSQIFKRRKSSTQGWRQQLSGQPGAPGALQGPREASLYSTGHQAASRLLKKSVVTLQCCPRFHPEQEIDDKLGSCQRHPQHTPPRAGGSPCSLLTTRLCLTLGSLLKDVGIQSW